MTTTAPITRREFVRSVRAEWAEETGEPITAVTADVLIDQMCDAFVHMVEGAGIEAAVRGDRRTAFYLVFKWTGADRKALRSALGMDEVAA